MVRILLVPAFQGGGPSVYLGPAWPLAPNETNHPVRLSKTPSPSFLAACTRTEHPLIRLFPPLLGQEEGKLDPSPLQLRRGSPHPHRAPPPTSCGQTGLQMTFKDHADTENLHKARLFCPHPCCAPGVSSAFHPGTALGAVAGNMVPLSLWPCLCCR